MSWWVGVVMGVGVMGGYALLRILTHRLALRQAERKSFLVIALGGMSVRMLALLGAVALVLTLVPVHEEGFVGTVLLLFVLSMVVEIFHVTRRSGGDLSGR